MPNISDELHDGILIHTVNLLRLAEGERQAVVKMLEQLEGKLIGDLNSVVGKTDNQIARLQALLKQTQGTISETYKAVAKQNGETLSKVAQMEAAKTVNLINGAIGVGVATVGMSAPQLAAIASDIM